MTRVGYGTRSILLIFGLVCLRADRAAGADGRSRFVASPALVFEYHGEPDLRLPTAVTVAKDGTVYVVDGVRDRILVFTPRGEYREEIRQVGEQPLARPISAKVDRDGMLWIADTGNGRVVARAPDGGLLREIRCPNSSESTHVPDVTDVAISGDGRTVWLVDNDAHRVGRFDVETGSLSFFGGQSEALGRFYHPFMLAVNPAGDVFVSESANARVQILTSTGESTGSIGTLGVDLGDLYRPKGVALDRDGNVWVVDGTMGVIQVFQPSGVLLDVVRDEQGRPLKLRTPCGLALDKAGDLYVAELLPNRVQKFTIQVNPAAPVELTTRPAPAGEPLQPRSCVVCHLEWIEPLAHGESTPLMSPPPMSPEQPTVSRPETCLSCHDGSVVDSRRRIWIEHGHATQVTPPATMKVPPNLPLVNGQLACRTCHAAHGTPQQEGDMGSVFFLRVPNTASELCASCHADKTGGPEARMHPTGGMPWAVPEALLDAGAKPGPNARELTCQVCHTPHGATHEHLLVLGAESSQLCLTCHDQVRPGMFRSGGPAEHPLSPLVNAEQAEAVRDMGTQLGPGQHLICLSCHQFHHAKGQRFLLADDLTDGQMCLRCHSDKRTVVATPHDLRVSFPQERNRLGMTPSTGGPCSACHLFHNYARAAETSELDPDGRCITCHEPGRPAEKLSLPPVNHPPVDCTKCHDPHTEQYGRFLRQATYMVCGKCHTDQTAAIGGPHDVLYSASQVWPSVATDTHDTCLACHRPHASDSADSFRAGLAPGVAEPGAPCLACHPDAAPQADSKIALLHPQAALQPASAPAVPSSQGSDQRQVSCPTCHDPHRSAAVNENLLRINAGARSQQVCSTCHTQVANIGAIGHAAESLRAAGFETDTCGPCHMVHGNPQSVEPRYLRPKQLMRLVPSTQPVAVAIQVCVACHHEGGPVAPPTIATHPSVGMFNPIAPDTPGYLPLFNERGEVDPTGTIACRTCHLTHGRSTPLPALTRRAKTSSRELRARNWHLRSFDSGSVCIICHGFDALRRFMYFHDPARRSGPLRGGWPGR
jgi:predicted CXXCH cytochrome family protein